MATPHTLNQKKSYFNLKYPTFLIFWKNHGFINPNSDFNFAPADAAPGIDTPFPLPPSYTTNHARPALSFKHSPDDLCIPPIK